MPSVGPRLAALAVVLTALNAHAAVVKNLSTGIDDLTGAKLPQGAQDPDFIIVASPTAGLVGQAPISHSTNIPGVYVQDTASTASRWLAFDTGQGDNGIGLIPGLYRFQTTVNLAGFDSSTAAISSFRYAVDNQLTNILINDVSIFSQTPTDFTEQFQSFTPLSGNLGTGLFHDGANTIVFEVFNIQGFGSPNAMALRIEGSVTASVPEPATGLLTLSCLPLLLARHRRSKHESSLA